MDLIKTYCMQVGNSQQVEKQKMNLIVKELSKRKYQITYKQELIYDRIPMFAMLIQNTTIESSCTNHD